MRNISLIFMSALFLLIQNRRATNFRHVEQTSETSNEDGDKKENVYLGRFLQGKHTHLYKEIQQEGKKGERLADLFVRKWVNRRKKWWKAKHSWKGLSDQCGIDFLSYMESLFVSFLASTFGLHATGKVYEWAKRENRVLHYGTLFMWKI